MTFELAAIGIVAGGTSAGIGAMSAGDASQAYKQAIKGVETTLAASDKNIDVLMTPYRKSGRMGLNMLDAAINPVATADYSMPVNPGTRPKSDWRAYATLDEQAAPATAAAPARPGLAGMMRK